MSEGKKDQPNPGAKPGSAKDRGNGTILLLAALDMSWRLAIVVLVPIIGGFELDKHLGLTPVLTVAGFVIAMAGVFVILKQTVAGADNKFNAGQGR